jgi:acetylglutamate kinase
MTANQNDDLFAKIKAETLIESLPWLQRFHQKVVVVKFGGNAMVDENLQRAFAQDMAYLRWVGIRPVVVHGGGPQISAKLAELNIESEFRGGFRVTTEESIGVVRDVLRNEISEPLAHFVRQIDRPRIQLDLPHDAVSFGRRLPGRRRNDGGRCACPGQPRPVARSLVAGR